MQNGDRQFNFWYAVNHTHVVRPPMRALETFGETRITFHHLAELADAPGKVHVREGRLMAHKPALIMPDSFLQEDALEGFGPQAHEYLEFLKQNQDHIRILQYGYHISKETFSEQIINDSLEAVTDRVIADVVSRKDDFSVVLQGVDEPWDVSLLHFFFLHSNASVPFNLHQIGEMNAREAQRTQAAMQQEIDLAFMRARANSNFIHDLATLLHKRGVFEQYQDQFFNLIKHN